jgi:cytochrome P450
MLTTHCFNSGPHAVHSLEHVLKTEMHNWVKGDNFCAVFGPVLGHGIFTSDGPRWIWQRKLATHIFSVKG